MIGDNRDNDNATMRIDIERGEAPPTTFLSEYLGEWTEDGRSISIVSNPLRDEPGWDGSIRLAVGVVNQDGSGVLSLAPRLANRVFDVFNRSTVSKEEVGKVAELIGAREFFGVFRWSTQIGTFEDIGEWIDANEPIVPDWLKPFGHEVLMAFDEERRYVGGVGIKHHLENGREIAVVVEERAAGRQIARRLVAKAAKQIIEEGYVPIYLHAESNVASAKVAEAVGFRDLGWKIIGMIFD